MTAELVLPSDVEAEVCVLGAMLLDGDAADLARRVLAPSDFYRDAHGVLFAAIGALRDEQLAGFGAFGEHGPKERGPDVVLLRQELARRGVLEKVGGVTFLSRVMASVPTAANAEHYARAVRETAVRRAGILAAHDLAAAIQRGDEIGDLAAAGARLAESLATESTRRGSGLLGLTGPEILARYEAGEIKPRECFLEKLLLLRELNLVAGGVGAGKSALTWEVAILASASVSASVARWKIAPHPDGRPWRVGLVLGSESTLEEVRERLAAILGLGAWPKSLHVYETASVDDPPGIGTSEGLRWVEDRIRDDELEVLVLDGALSLMEGDPNDIERVRSIMKRLRRMCRKFGTTIVLVVHYSKTSSGGDVRRSVEKVFGSTSWGAWASSVLALEHETDASGKARESNRRVLVHAKMRGPAVRPVLLELDEETLRWRDLGDLGAPAPDDDPRRKVPAIRLRELLLPAGTWRTKGDLCAALECSDSTFRTNLPRIREVLGDELEVGRAPGKGETRLRLIPLEELAAAAEPRP